MDAYKPGSVRPRGRDGHFSRRAIARTLQQPTRGVLVETGHLSPLIWPCTDRGLPCRTCCQMRGGLLPRRFTLTGGALPAVYSLWHFPSRAFRRAPAPRRYLAIRPVVPGLSSVGRTHRDRPAAMRNRTDAIPDHSAQGEVSQL